MSAGSSFIFAEPHNPAQRFVLRMASSFKFTAGVYASSLVIGSVLFSLIERVPLLDAFYWAGVTAPTVGYGDITPSTTAGKLLAIGFIHFWSFIFLPIIIAKVVSFIMPDFDQWTHREQLWTMNSLASIAAALDITLEPQPKHTDEGNVAEYETS